MAASAGDPDIQANVSVLLEDYPFLKVFSRPPEIDIFSEPIFTILQHLIGLQFRINFEGNKAVSVTPFFLDSNFKPPVSSIKIIEDKKNYILKISS